MIAPRRRELSYNRRANINPEVSQPDPMAISPLLALAALAALAAAGLLPQAPRPAAVIPIAVFPPP